MIRDEKFDAGLSGLFSDWVFDEMELLNRCESPIERRFAEAFIIYCAMVNGRPIGLEWRDKPIGSRTSIFLEPQYKVGPYRVDFLVWWGDDPARLVGIGVECDGHDFHEKTKHQAARDKARDRYLSAHLAKVVRFTGSEIFNSPFECAAEVFGLADGLYCDQGMRR